jgi:hypothetical protein
MLLRVLRQGTINETAKDKQVKKLPSPSCLPVFGMDCAVENSLFFVKFFHELVVLRHALDVLPVAFIWESHDVEDSIQLLFVVWVVGLNVLLTTMKNRLRRQ